jgi:hypothetical protein
MGEARDLGLVGNSRVSWRTDRQDHRPVGKIGDAIGQADDALLLRVDRALALFLGIV